MSKTMMVAALMLPALGGCVAQSVRDIREREPVLSADSTRSVQEISQCVSDAWIAAGITPNLVPRPDGVSLVHQVTVSYTMVLAVLDLDRTASGTHAVLRIQKTIWAKQNRKAIDKVRTCL